jgi:hypothetical protein
MLNLVNKNSDILKFHIMTLRSGDCFELARDYLQNINAVDGFKQNLSIAGTLNK